MTNRFALQVFKGIAHEIQQLQRNGEVMSHLTPDSVFLGVDGLVSLQGAPCYLAQKLLHTILQILSSLEEPFC